ncbi:hypothetical protein Tco_0987933 [Tanacetum coccineum]
MPPRMTTRSASRPAAESGGGRMGKRARREGGRVREPRRRNVDPTDEPVGQENDQGILMREELCPSNEMQKLEIELWNHAMVGADHAAYTDRFHELARLVLHLVTSENRKTEMYVYGLAPQIRGMVAATESKTMQKAVQLAGALIDEAIRNGADKKSTKKKGNMGEPSKDKNGKDDNKRIELEILLLQP